MRTRSVTYGERFVPRPRPRLRSPPCPVTRPAAEASSGSTVRMSPPGPTARPGARRATTSSSASGSPTGGGCRPRPGLLISRSMNSLHALEDVTRRHVRTWAGHPGRADLLAWMPSTRPSNALARRRSRRVPRPARAVQSIPKESRVNLHSSNRASWFIREGPNHMILDNPVDGILQAMPSGRSPIAVRTVCRDGSAGRSTSGPRGDAARPVSGPAHVRWDGPGAGPATVPLDRRRGGSRHSGPPAGRRSAGPPGAILRERGAGAFQN